jgi:hypothetical protein
MNRIVISCLENAMSRRDVFHDAVKNALVKEGWTITHDPYPVGYHTKTLEVDLGAELPVAAEREGRKIAVEIKSFVSEGVFVDLYKALGQFALYRSSLERQEPDRKLYLAVPYETYQALLAHEDGRRLQESMNLALIVYVAEFEEIEQWIE